MGFADICGTWLRRRTSALWPGRLWPLLRAGPEPRELRGDDLWKGVGTCVAVTFRLDSGVSSLRGCLVFLGPYPWANFTILALGVWAVAQRDSVDAISMVSWGAAWSWLQDDPKPLCWPFLTRSNLLSLPCVHIFHFLKPCR